MDPNLNNNVNLNRIVLPPVQPAPADSTAQKAKRQVSTKEKVIGGLSALAILGTAIAFAIKRGGKKSEETFKYVMQDGVLHKLFPNGKTVIVPDEAFKTVVNKDGSSQRLLRNGNTVTIGPKEISEKGDGWSQTVSVTDLDGKRVAKRDRYFHKTDDCEDCRVTTFYKYNSDDIPTLTTSRDITKKSESLEVETMEWHYNEKGMMDEKNLEKYRNEQRIWDKEGNRKKVYSKIQERSEAGPLDEHTYSLKVEDNGNIYECVSNTEHLENGVNRMTDSYKRVDSNDNVIWDKEDFMEDDKINRIRKVKSHDRNYEVDENGARSLKHSSIHNSTEVLDENGKSTNDYLEFYSKNYSKGDASFDSIKRPHYRVRDYKRNEDGVGVLKKYSEEVNGTQIEGTYKEKSGPDVKPV